MHLDVGKLAVHGFAIELAPTTAHAKVLNTREGVRALIDLVSTTASRVVVVRRCNTIAWAAQLLLLPQPCDDTGACADRDKVETLRPLLPARLVAKLAECRENEASLRSLMATVQLPQLSINFETTLQFQNEQRVQSMQQLSAFLRVPMTNSPSMPEADWRVPNVQELQDHFASESVERQQLVTRSKLSDAKWSCDTRWDAAGQAACSDGRCAASAAAALLTANIASVQPIMAVGAHSAEGGSAALFKVFAHLCKAVLTPKLGVRCAYRSAYEGCDPASVDLCFLHDARFSEGRYSSRGYRYVHVHRDPAEMIVRSFLREYPNATHAFNSSALLEGVEAQARRVLAEGLHEMAAAIESHTADRSALLLRIEDLTSPTSANATLTKLFGFLLGPRAVPRNFVEELVASAWKVMAGAARSEEAGAVQRAHLLKLLQKRPLKCSHVARMQSLLDYSPMKCVERAGVQQKPPQRHPAAGSAASHRRRLRQTSDPPLGSPSRAQRRGHRSGTAPPLRARILLGSARFRFRAPAAG